MLLLGVGLAVSGCTAGPAAVPPVPSPASSAPAFTRYVALGDSFTAGPFVPTTDLAGGCLRSDHDYPALVARQLHVPSFTDVSCSAARTADLSSAQHTFGDTRVPPQLDALTTDTDLVTLGIGGNDFGLFGTVVQTCTRLRPSDPAGAPCTELLAGRRPSVRTLTHRISGRVTGAVRQIRARAPHATVVVVGYLRLVPGHGSCAQLPLAVGDYAVGRRVSRLLDAALERAARRTGALFADAYAASAGHDICSADPWVNGRHTDRARAAAYHPFAAGMRAVARLVLTELAQR
jgi:lysophospholipase L1-like esterase